MSTRRHAMSFAGALLLGCLSGCVPVGSPATQPSVQHSYSAAAAATRSLTVPYTGVNYYMPSAYFTGCIEWTWLTPACYRNARKTAYRMSPRQMLIADVRGVKHHSIGRFYRVWVSLDQLFDRARWNKLGRYGGYDSRALHNLDDALKVFHRNRIKVDLVFFAYNKATPEYSYQFHPEALDGHHEDMRKAYVHAVHDILIHLKRNKVDAATVKVVDLFNEVYYQLEKYYGTQDTIDSAVIYPFVLQLSSVAKKAKLPFAFTVSDTGKLLHTDTDAAHLYPVDVYDIHLYDDSPAQFPYLDQLRSLGKPWFVGEAGCKNGSVSTASQCFTYDGNNPFTYDADRWWLEHLSTYGARAVLIESRNTVWEYGSSPRNLVLTRVGRLVSEL